MTKLVLHVGQMKSGTTFIQNILRKNRKPLEESGWLYPGKRFNHQHETYGICGGDIFWVNERMRENNDEIGKKLIDECKDGLKNKNVLISSEALSSLDSSGIERFVSTFGNPDEVILTVRDLYRVFPSAWQQDLKGGHSRSLEEFFELLKTQRKDKSGFWKTYSYGDVVKKWAKICPVKVIIVPGMSNNKGGALWESFSSTVGLPTNLDVNIDSSQLNLSLNIETANFVRSLIKIINQDKRFSGHKSKILKGYFDEMVFPCAGQNRGEKILPPISYKAEMKDWNIKEYNVMKRFASEIVGNEKDLVEYSGKYCRGDAVSAPSEVIDELAFQVASNFLRKK